MDLKIIFLLGTIAVNLPAEPPEVYIVDDRVDTIIGFYYREYSILNNGRVNYITARKVFDILPENDSIIVAADSPLFYWFDWNGNGKFEADEIWIDKEEKGIDIEPY